METVYLHDFKSVLDLTCFTIISMKKQSVLNLYLRHNLAICDNVWILVMRSSHFSETDHSEKCVSEDCYNTRLHYRNL
jgi:hypothetical protein